MFCKAQDCFYTSVTRYVTCTHCTSHSQVGYLSMPKCLVRECVWQFIVTTVVGTADRSGHSHDVNGVCVDLSVRELGLLGGGPAEKCPVLRILQQLCRLVPASEDTHSVFSCRGHTIHTQKHSLHHLYKYLSPGNSTPSAKPTLILYHGSTLHYYYNLVCGKIHNCRSESDNLLLRSFTKPHAIIRFSPHTNCRNKHYVHVIIITYSPLLKRKYHVSCCSTSA